MKKLALIVLAVIVLATPIASVAQVPVPTGTIVQAGNTAWYEVVTKDNPWKLFGPKWTDLRDLNSWLETDKRIDYRSADDVWVLIHPRERLLLNDELRSILEARGVTLIPTTPPPATAKPPATTPNVVVEKNPPTQQASSNWLWLLFALALVAIAYLAYSAYWKGRIQGEVDRQAEAARVREARERELTQNPITSGTPYVPGGIPANQPQRLQNFFEQQATNRYAERNPHLDRNTIRVEQVGPIESGTIAGEGEVGYLGGTWRPRRIETPIEAYQARYRYPDGTEENLQCLMGCMNPVRMGGEVMRGFTFTPRQAVVPVPEPPAAAPEAVPHPAIAVRRIREAAQSEQQNTALIGDQMMVFPLGYHLSIDPETNAVILEGTSVRMRLETKPKVAVAATTATGTSDK